MANASIAQQSSRQHRPGGGGRSRGSRPRRGGRSTQSQAAPGPAAAQHATESKGKRPTLSKSPSSHQVSTAAGKAKIVDDGDDEAEVCFICASPIIHVAVAPCNHKTCHVCSLRMRALYKNQTCAHCRARWDFVIFAQSDKNFEDYTHAEIVHVDDSLGIKYEKQEIRDDTLLVLRYNCPDPDCDVACLGWPDLHQHVQAAHHKLMCDLCVRNKKVFTHEHQLFTKDQLRKHEDRGDDRPGSVEQSGFRGHPKCGFCRTRFYSDDELYSHCREKHEKCHICERTNPGRPQYYLNYDTLEQHFRTDHYLCLDRECLEKKFIVFETEMDIRGHQLESHPNGLTKDHRRVDLTEFSVRERYQPPRARENRSRGRGRDPNAETVLASSAQPMRRDEIAFHRQMAIRTAPSASGRSFGGHLSSVPAEIPPTPQPFSSSATTSRPSFPALANPQQPHQHRTSTLDGETVQPRSKEDELRQIRHQAVIERAMNLVRGNQKKLDIFRSNISNYKNSKLTGQQLIESILSVFDAPSAEIGKLVKELAEIFEITSKKEDILTAWNDRRAANEDYPLLPGSSTGASATSFAGRRVLRLKNATAQSSRSASTASWGTAAATKKTSNYSQRPLAQSAMARITPWSGSQAGTSASSVQTSARSSEANISGARSNTNQAFPALPPTATPSTTALTPGHDSSSVLRLNREIPDPGRMWGASRDLDNRTGIARPIEIEDDTTGGVNAAKKKGGRKKQTLMHFG